MAAFPTLSATPIYPLTPNGELEDNIIRSPYTAGYEQSRPRFTRARRIFGLNYNLQAADEALLRDFELTTLHYGADSFTWVHPISGLTYVVQLTAPIKFGEESYGLCAVSLTIKEV